VIVYTDSELDVIYENMLDYLVDKFLKQELSVEGFSLGELSDIVYPIVIRGRLETNFSLEDCRSKICELLGGSEVSTDTGLVVDL
jgi:hypothetical protein